jgi:hypothetical protein
VLRAAALTELWLTGHLTDASGRAPADPPRVAARVIDPVLATVLAQVEAGRSRSYERWIQRTDHTIGPAVRDHWRAAAGSGPSGGASSASSRST